MEEKTCKACHGNGYAYYPCIEGAECDADHVDECHDCSGKGMILIDKEFTTAQEDQLELLYSGIFHLMQEITHEEIEWDMEWIGYLADVITNQAVKLTGKSEMEIYPYHDEDQEEVEEDDMDDIPF